ncbi:uncharacterized protein LOC106709208 [Papilio machaon]|uniref:uncharacterized protein LOC106709208 n=1 Tax=Papilio machaon TaxID=76193 RepID=UPI001E66335F|nr:uncharacterized protein LOC106709208 [Papilio machaon]
MSRYLFYFVFICYMQYVMGYSQLCDNKTRSCTTQILGHDYTEDSCQLEYFKPDSPACRAMDFAPISPNDHIGGVSLKPYSLQYDHVTPLGTVYTVNHTVLNITFSNIKWKTMKFRFQFSKQKNSDNHCRNIVISNNVTINDQSMFYYDCYWPISDGNPNGQSHILDFEATDDVVVNRGQYYFNIPTPQMLSPTATINEWKPFIYIEILTDKMKLHVVPPPSHLKVTAYEIAVFRECDKETLCTADDLVANKTIKLKNNLQEVTYETSMLKKSGSYYYVVTVIHDACNSQTGDCQYMESPRIRITNEVQPLSICIASITALIVATLFAYYIALRVMRRYCCTEYKAPPAYELPSPPKILVVYSPVNRLHAECVASFITYLRCEYGFELMYEGDISSTSHADPFIWASESFRIATHIMYIVGPAEETNLYNNIYDKPIITAHRDVDNIVLAMIKANRNVKSQKDIINIFFEHSNGQLPIETRHDKAFFLLKDWQKLISYLSQNMLPKKQIMRTEKGKCFIEDLSRAKKLLSIKQDDVVIRCEKNWNEKKVLL